MAAALKILGQSNPVAVTPTDLYTVPALTSAVISSLVVCNQGGTVATFRVSVSVGGGATAPKDYLYYDLAIPANDTFVATIGLAIGAGDKVRVYASTGNVSFTVSGEEDS